MQEQSFAKEIETNKGKEKEPAQARKGEPINGSKQKKTPQQQDIPPRAKTEKSCFRPEITPEIEEALPDDTENFLVHVRGLSEGESADSVISMNDGQHWETPAPGFLRFPSDTLTGEEIKDIVSDMGIKKPADEECATRVDLLKGNLENPGYIAEERNHCGDGADESHRTCHGHILDDCAMEGAEHVTCTGDVNDCAWRASHVTCEGDVTNDCAYNSQDVTCKGDVGDDCAYASQDVTCEGNVGDKCDTDPFFPSTNVVCRKGAESMPKSSKNLLLDIDLCANGTALNAQGAIPDSACIGNISDANTRDVFCDGPVFIPKQKKNVTLLDVGCASDKGSNGSDEGSKEKNVTLDEGCASDKGSKGCDEGKGSNLWRDVGIGIGATLAGAGVAAGAAGTGVACARSCEKRRHGRGRTTSTRSGRG